MGSHLRTTRFSGRTFAAFATGAATFFYAGFAHAADTVDVGLNYATEIGLATTDIRTTIARIVNYFLGLLGIVAVCIILYGGWVYMTAGGEQAKIQKAKDIIKNGVIGLLIIMSAFGIAQFVINAIQGGTGGVTETVTTDNQNPLCTSNCSKSFSIKSITPSGSGPGASKNGFPRNSSFVAAFNRVVKESDVNSTNISVKKCNQAFTRSGEVVTFLPFTANPAADCVTPVNGSFQTVVNGFLGTSKVTFTATGYFDADFWYRIEFSTNIQDVDNKNLVCGSYTAVCKASAAMNNIIDLTAPTVSAGLSSSCLGYDIPVRASAKDDSVVAQLEFLLDADQRSFDDAFNVDTYETVIKKNVINDLDRHTLRVRAYDSVPNIGTAEKGFSVQPAHCCNGKQEAAPLETGTDCGGECLACVGGNCKTDDDCANSSCVNGKCTIRPEIMSFSPTDVGPGTIVTVKGRWFGGTPGSIVFLGGADSTDDKIATACAPGAWRQCATEDVGKVTGCAKAGDSWANVAVPEGAATGALKVVTSAGLSDLTNDNNGLKISDFKVGTEVKPGICLVRPDQGVAGTSFAISGSGFGTKPGTVKLFQTTGSFDFPASEWPGTNSPAGTPVTASVPAMPEGQYKMKVAVDGGKESENDVWFTVQANSTARRPNIAEISPSAGPAGSYVTLRGSGFGQSGIVYFYTGSSPDAVDTTAKGIIPPCANSWSDGTVVVKAPANFGLSSPLGEQILSGGATERVMKVMVKTSDLSSNTVDFTLNTDILRPGICSVTPTFGPVGTAVKIEGERFGTGPASPADYAFGLNFFNGKNLVCAFRPTTSCEGGVSCGADGACIPNPARATTKSWSEASAVNVIEATVPNNAQSGLVRVVAGNVLSSNGVPFALGNCKEKGGDKFCSAAFMGDGLVCCPNGTCDTAVNCSVSAKKNTFAWRFSTALMPEMPVVVERQSCGVLLQSPSPYRESADACTNAVVYFELNNSIYTPSVIAATGEADKTAATVILERCADGKACATPSVVSAGVEVMNANRGVKLTPIVANDRLDVNAWYRVTLVSLPGSRGIRDLRSGGAGKYLDGDRDGTEGGNYVFMFRTRQDGASCEVSSVAIAPPTATIGTQYKNSSSPTAHFSAGLIAANCNIVRGCSIGTTHKYDWSGNPIFLELIGAKIGSCLEAMDVGGKSEISSTELKCTVSDTAGRTQTRAGTAAVTVKFTDPAVVSYVPKCDAACVNAAIKMTFNTSMDPGTFVINSGNASGGDSASTVELFRCRNVSCNAPFAEVVRINDSQFSNDDSTVTISRTGDMTADTYYLVRLRGKRADGDVGGVIRSGSGVALSGLNSGNFFTWKFKTKNSQTPCAPVRTTVEPAAYPVQKTNEAVAISAIPFGAPDECDKAGQQLDAWSLNWIWTSDKASGASGELVRGLLPAEQKTGTPATTLTALSTAPGGNFGCSASCTLLGSQTSQPQCGNGEVEKGEDCDGTAGCDPVKCLMTGTSSSCGDGGAPGVDEQCEKIGNEFPPGCSTTKCLFTGSTAGKSVCGDGLLGDGEACDDSNKTNGDGCSSNCLNEGSIPSCLTIADVATRRPGINCNYFCGNGRPEPGEDADCDAAGGIDPSVCNQNTCLKRSTQCTSGPGCGSNGLLLGSSAMYTPSSSASFCRDGAVGTGEDPYCESGITSGAKKTGPFQFFSTLEPAEGAKEKVYASVSGVATANQGFIQLSGPPGVGRPPVIGPHVPEVACTRAGNLSNPSPFRGSVNACPGADVLVRFVPLMDTSTFTTSNILMYDCGVSDATCGAASNMTINPTFINGTDETTLQLVTPGILAKHYYRVVIKSGVGGVTDKSIPPRPLDGLLNGGKADYVFTFKAVDDAESNDCALAGVAVLPSSYELKQFGIALPDNLTPTIATDDGFLANPTTVSCNVMACNSTNISAVNWSFKKGTAAYSDPKLALGAVAPATSPACRQTVTATANPVNTEFSINAAATPKANGPAVSGTAAITLTPQSGPRVVDRPCYPDVKPIQTSSPAPLNGSLACPGASVEVTFDRAMDASTATAASIKIRKCGNGATKGACTADNGTFAAPIFEGGGKVLHARGISPAFEEGYWYEVALLPTLSDAYGLRLETGGKPEYAFSFQVKNSPLCRIVSASLAPDSLNFSTQDQILPFDKVPPPPPANYAAVTPVAGNCNPMECTATAVPGVVWSMENSPTGFRITQKGLSETDRCFAKVKALWSGKTAGQIYTPDNMKVTLSCKDDKVAGSYDIVSNKVPVRFDTCTPKDWDVCKNMKLKPMSCRDGGCVPGPELKATYPVENTQGVCRNTFISATFDRSLFASSATTDVVLARVYGKAECPNGLEQISGLPNVPDDNRSFFASLWRRLLAVLSRLFGGHAAVAAAGSYCDPRVAYTYALAGTEVQMLLTDPLVANTEYAIIVKATATDNAGVSIGQAGDPPTARIFKTGPDICSLESISISPSSFLLAKPQETRILTVAGKSKDGQRIVPTSGLAWTWYWYPSSDNMVSVKSNYLWYPDGGHYGHEPIAQVSPVSAATQGSSFVKVLAQFYEVRPDGSFIGKNSLEASARATVMYCDNPWPAAQACGNKAQVDWPWDLDHSDPGCWPAKFCSGDGSLSCSTNADCVDAITKKSLGACVENTVWRPFYDLTTNTSFYYCRDGQQSGDSSVLLPGLDDSKLVVVKPGAGVIREYLLSYKDAAPTEPWARDILFLRFYQNPQHVSVGDWYTQSGLTGAPKPMKIGGYDGLLEGLTAYIGSAAVASSGNPPKPTLFTNITVAAANNDASKETVAVFNQIISTIDLNRNIQDANLCEDRDGMPVGTGFCSGDSDRVCVGLGTPCDNYTKGQCISYPGIGVCKKRYWQQCIKDSDCPKDESGISTGPCFFAENTSCNADLDCRSIAGAPPDLSKDWYCDANQAKLIRDVRRWSDVMHLREQINSAPAIPTLEQGSYLRAVSTSVWPSWTGNFAADLGSALAVDPLNKLGRCEATASPVYSPNAATCWDSKNNLFKCPDGSHIYAFESVGGQDFRVKADFETNCNVASEANCRSRSPLCDWGIDVNTACRSWSNDWCQSILSQTDCVSNSYYCSWTDTACTAINDTAVCQAAGAVGKTEESCYNKIGCYWYTSMGTCNMVGQWGGATCIEKKDSQSCNSDTNCVWLPPSADNSGSHCQYREGKLYLGGWNLNGNICNGGLLGASGTCGDGIVSTGEECEPGKGPMTRACTVTTTASYCRFRQPPKPIPAGDKTPTCVKDSDCITGTGANMGPCDTINEVRGGFETLICTTQCKYAIGSRCRAGRCGDGVTQSPEVCDDGSFNGTYGHCNSNCSGLGPRPGDGFKQPNEACDCGTQNGVYRFYALLATSATCNDSNHFSCSWDSKGLGPRCGDGVVNDTSEKCDGGVQESKGYCAKTKGISDAEGKVTGATGTLNPCSANADCTQPETCMLTGGQDPTKNVCPRPEQRLRRTCPNTPSGTENDQTDNCRWRDWTCTAAGSCGDGATQFGEECDSGSVGTTNGMCVMDKVNDYACKNARCGDGYVRNQGNNPEDCDDGKNNGTACVPQYDGSSCTYCSQTCHVQTVTAPFCGDKKLQGPGSTPVSGPEECDGSLGLGGWVCLSDVTVDRIAFVDSKAVAADRLKIILADQTLWPKCGAGDCKRACPSGYSSCDNSGSDTDKDGLADNCDPDADGDGVPANRNGKPAASGDADCDDRVAAMHPAWDRIDSSLCNAAWNQATQAPDRIPWPYWNDGEPNDWPNLWDPSTSGDSVPHEEDCVQMYANGTWNDLSCTANNQVYGICNNLTRTATTGSQISALAFCADEAHPERGGLAVIDSTTRNVEVRKACNDNGTDESAYDKSCWIGLDDTGEANHWVWTGCYRIQAGRGQTNGQNNSCIVQPGLGSPIIDRAICEANFHYWYDNKCNLNPSDSCGTHIKPICESKSSQNCSWINNTCINNSPQ